MYPGRRHHLAHIPTIALLLIFALAPWVGIALFILRSIDRDAEKKEQKDFLNRTGAAFSSSEQTHNERVSFDYSISPDLPTKEQRRARKRQKKLISLCGILGALLLLAGLSGLGDFTDLAAAGAFLHLDWGGLFSSLGQVLGGGGAVALSIRMNRTRKLEQLLDNIVGDRNNFPLSELFASAGLSYNEGRRVLESAIEHGCFGAGAYIDNRTDYLVVRGPAPAPAPAQPAKPAAPEGESAGQQLLRQLREANVSISDPVMNSKVARLEQISSRIFALAEQDPGKEPQLQKFMDYYLPTALKLLNTYAQMDRQGVQGQNILEAKNNIKRSMDLLIQAFENQLDKLFQADALDVSADIAALEGMMNLDGLTGSSDFGPVKPG